MGTWQLANMLKLNHPNHLKALTLPAPNTCLHVSPLLSLFSWTLNKHEPSLVKSEYVCRKILEKVRWGKSFFCLSLLRKMTVAAAAPQRQWNTRLVCSESKTQSASLLLLVQLLTLPLLLQLHRSSCRWPGLCQCAIDGHGLNAGVTESFKSHRFQKQSSSTGASRSCFEWVVPGWQVPYLCDHPADVASAGGQQDGVGLFGQIGERWHVLLSHAEWSGRVAVLHENRRSAQMETPHSPQWPGRQTAAATHLLWQCLRQDANGLGFGLSLCQDGLSFTWNWIKFLYSHYTMVHTVYECNFN